MAIHIDNSTFSARAWRDVLEMNRMADQVAGHCGSSSTTVMLTGEQREHYLALNRQWRSCAVSSSEAIPTTHPCHCRSIIGSSPSGEAGPLLQRWPWCIMRAGPNPDSRETTVNDGSGNDLKSLIEACRQYVRHLPDDLRYLPWREIWQRCAEPAERPRLEPAGRRFAETVGPITDRWQRSIADMERRIRAPFE